MRSYQPETLFDQNGRFVPELAALAPTGRPPHGRQSRMPTAASCWWNWICPISATYALPVPHPATERHESTRQLGKLLRDIYRATPSRRNFRLFCPDETNSNRLGNVFEVENRCFVGPDHRHRRPRLARLAG